jgi:hypothetical protein
MGVEPILKVIAGLPLGTPAAFEAMEPASPGHRAALTSAQRQDRCHGARRA